MAQTKTVAVEVDTSTVQRPWDDSDLVTDWSAFPDGYGILLNERLIFLIKEWSFNRPALDLIS